MFTKIKAGKPNLLYLKFFLLFSVHPEFTTISNTPKNYFLGNFILARAVHFERQRKDDLNTECSPYLYPVERIQMAAARWRFARNHFAAIRFAGDNVSISSLDAKHFACASIKFCYQIHILNSQDWQSCSSIFVLLLAVSRAF